MKRGALSKENPALTVLEPVVQGQRGASTERDRPTIVYHNCAFVRCGSALLVTLRLRGLPAFEGEIWCTIDTGRQSLIFIFWE